MIELLVVLVFVLMNGFFSLSEMAVITSRKARLKEMAKESRGAQRALELAEHPESFLSAVQVWITLLGLLTGSFGGASMARRLQGPLGLEHQRRDQSRGEKTNRDDTEHAVLLGQGLPARPFQNPSASP